MRINFEDLPSIREKHRNEKIVICSGCFDLSHAGHILFLEDCKKHGDVLVVVVGSDETVRRDKRGGRPILNEHLRVKMIDSLKPVDYVLTDYVISEDAHPLKLFDLLFEKLRPDAYVVNEDAFDLPYRRDLAKKHRVSLVVLPRTAPKEFEGISTTKIIDRLRNLKD